MKKINIRKIYYHARHRYFTMNNIVIGVALVVGAGWAWGSIGMMQRNYALQKEIDGKNRQEMLAELETQNLKYQQRYYQSSEYQELAIRERLGLAQPDEKVLFLPPNTAMAKSQDIQRIKKTATLVIPPSNFQQWMNFLFGGNLRDNKK